MEIKACSVQPFFQTKKLPRKARQSRRQRVWLVLWIMVLQTILPLCLFCAQPVKTEQEHSINSQDLCKILMVNEPLVLLGPSARQMLARQEGYDADGSLITLALFEEAVTKKIIDTHISLDGSCYVPTLEPLSVTITHHSTGRSVTPQLYRCQDAVVAPTASYADFDFSFDRTNSDGAVQLGFDLLGNRAFNDSFVHVNADDNADMRITGSVALLGKLTLPWVASNATSGSNVVINAAGCLGTGYVSGIPTFTCDVYMAPGTKLWTNKIAPRSPTTTTTFCGSINLPNTTTANAGSLQINGTRFLHNFGTSNTFVGSSAGNLTMSGASNTAIGSGSLSANTNGGTNIAIGANAGNALTTGSNNIDIGNVGVAAEAATIRIGTQGTQTACFVAGITGNTIIGSAVSVSAAGQLGVVLSSRKYKDNIQDMGNATDDLMKLRPVTFRYKEPNHQTLEYGLIAEEVEEVYKDLVCYKDGVPESVRYQSLPAMLLNEYQKLRKEFNDVSQRLKELEAKAIKND